MTTHRTSATARATRRATRTVALALAIAAVGATILATQRTDATPAPTAPTTAERLMATHDCWAGQAPADMAGVLPGAVVLQYGTHGARYTADPADVGAALDRVFAPVAPDVSHPALRVYGFCR